MNHLSDKFVHTCKLTLVSKKIDLVKRIKTKRQELRAWDYGSKFSDSVSDLLNSRRYAAEEKHLAYIVSEIDHSLSKISSGIYGICEETGQPIEMARLEAVPWARFTIEGENFWTEKNLRNIANGNNNPNKLGGAA